MRGLQTATATGIIIDGNMPTPRRLLRLHLRQLILCLYVFIKLTHTCDHNNKKQTSFHAQFFGARREIKPPLLLYTESQEESVHRLLCWLMHHTYKCTQLEHTHSHTPSNPTCPRSTTATAQPTVQHTVLHFRRLHAYKACTCGTPERHTCVRGCQLYCTHHTVCSCQVYTIY